jgi:rod shape-determining protein MreC
MSGNNSFKHSFDLIFKKTETGLFSIICVIFLISSRLNSEFCKNLSFNLVNISIPVIRIAALPFNTVINLLNDLHDLLEAKKENKILKSDLSKLQSFYIKSLNIYQENKELHNILNFVNSKSSNFKAVKIIGRSHQIFNQELFIDAGTNRDIKEGNIVTGSHGVIGRISEVGENKSRLLLLNDSTSRIPIISSKAGVRGILAGNGSSLMEILYLPKNHRIEKGDWIFTSGDGDTLPSGLFIGVVKKADQNYVGVAMAEDINNSDIVTVISY